MKYSCYSCNLQFFYVTYISIRLNIFIKTSVYYWLSVKRLGQFLFYSPSWPGRQRASISTEQQVTRVAAVLCSWWIDFIPTTKANPFAPEREFRLCLTTYAQIRWIGRFHVCILTFRVWLRTRLLLYCSPAVIAYWLLLLRIPVRASDKIFSRLKVIRRSPVVALSTLAVTYWMLLAYAEALRCFSFMNSVESNTRKSIPVSQILFYR